MESDILWETVINQSECALLESEQPETTHGEQSHIGDPQVMNAYDISAFIEVTAQSHKCDAQNITYYFEPIIGDDGHLVLDELVLIFSMKSLIGGELINRPIHRIRVVVPQEVQQRARAMLEKDLNLVSLVRSPEPASLVAKLPSSPEKVDVSAQTPTQIQAPISAPAQAKEETKPPAVRRKKKILPEPPQPINQVSVPLAELPSAQTTPEVVSAIASEKAPAKKPGRRQKKI